MFDGLCVRVALIGRSAACVTLIGRVAARATLIGRAETRAFASRWSVARASLCPLCLKMHQLTLTEVIPLLTSQN